MKKIIMICLFCFCAIGTFAQTKLEGVVLDKQRKPVAKLSMRIKGEMRNLRTNARGVFKIKKVYEGDTLMIFPSDGLVAYIPLRQVPTMTIHLDDNALRMQHDKISITTVYEKYEPEEFNPNIMTRSQIKRFEASNLIEVLRGRVAGLIIDEDDNGPVARMRGVSMSEKTEPLFIVDGVQYDSLQDTNNAVNVETIDQIEVLKDGSAYGMNGANGAILITTRR